MAYSTVITPAVQVRRRSERPTVDGSSIIQELGYGESKTYRFFWITAAQLQAEILILEAMASDGWVIVGDVSKTAVHEALDLFNAQVTLHRYVEEVMTTTTTTTTSSTTTTTTTTTA